MNGWSILTPASSRQARLSEEISPGSCSGLNSAARIGNACKVSQNRSLWCVDFNVIENGEDTIVSPAPAFTKFLARLPAWSCIHATAQSHRANRRCSSPSMGPSGSNNPAQALPCTEIRASISRHSRSSWTTGSLAQSTSSCWGNHARSLLIAGTASKTSPSAPG